jgi:hypothetical protein
MIPSLVQRGRMSLKVFEQEQAVMIADFIPPSYALIRYCSTPFIRSTLLHLFHAKYISVT